MQEENHQIVNRKLSELKPAEYNPRKITPEKLAELKTSLEEFGCVQPLLVNTHKGRKNIVVGGHQRLKALQELGYTEVPCIEIDLALEKEKELNIRLNKSGGEFDFDLLAKEFELEDLTEWGFDKHELPAFDGGSVGDFFEDGEEEKKTPPQIKVTHTCPHCKKEFEA